jgi:hypothetical protein
MGDTQALGAWGWEHQGSGEGHLPHTPTGDPMVHPQTGVTPTVRVAGMTWDDQSVLECQTLFRF